MNNFNINRIGKLFTFILIIWFMISDFIAKINYTEEYNRDVTGGLFALGHDIYFLSSAVIFAGCIIALSILFTNSNK